VTEGLNRSFGLPGHLNFGGKFYFLLFDTDLDFLFLLGKSRGTHFGFDISRNLKSNFEVHGERAWQADPVMADSGETRQVSRRSGTPTTLMGIRYLTARETTFFVEYYYNARGLTQFEFEQLFPQPGTDPDTFIPSLDLGNEPERLAVPNPMRHYLYMRARPFDILYFTPEITSFLNLHDGSFQVMPGLSYSPRTNLQLRLRGVLLLGGQKTEFGEKQSNYRVELRVGYFF